MTRQTICKYQILNPVERIEMPERSIILTVAEQRGEICMSCTHNCPGCSRKHRVGDINEERRERGLHAQRAQPGQGREPGRERSNSAGPDRDDGGIVRRSHQGVAHTSGVAPMNSPWRNALAAIRTDGQGEYVGTAHNVEAAGLVIHVFERVL